MQLKFWRLFVLSIVLIAPSAKALEGLSNLETEMYRKNLDYQAQLSLLESKKTLLKSASSGFYPTLNAVGGWGQNKTDDQLTEQKGSVGYLEGRLNLYRGSKDQALSSQKQIDVELIEVDVELKKREMRLQLTEVVSEMIYLHKLQEILQEELKATQSQRQMAAKKVSAGLTSSVDNLELDLRGHEIEIEIKQIDQMHSENHQKLMKLFGEEVKDFDLDKITFSPLSVFLNLEKEIKIDKNLGFKKAVLVKERFESEKAEIKSEFLPSLDLSFANGRLTPSEESPTKFNESKYAVTLTIPLFSGRDTYYKNRAAVGQIAAADQLKNQSRINADADFKILQTKISESLALNEINEKKLVAAQKYFEMTLDEYRRGIKNSPDLVGATDRIFSAKKRSVEIVKKLEILKIQLENLL